MSKIINVEDIHYSDFIVLVCELCAILFGVTQIKAIMYIPMLLFASMRSVYNSASFGNKDKVILLLLSLIVPDNYVIIIAIVLLFVIDIYKNGIKFKTHYMKFFTVSLVTYIVFNMLVNFRRSSNILFYLFFDLPFLLIGLFANGQINKKGMKNEDIDYLLKNFLLIQGTAIIFYAITHIKTIFSYIDNDWVSGTLGLYHSDVLMIICSFSFLYFLNRSSSKKKWKKWAMVAAVLALATTSVTYTIALAAAFMGVVFFTGNISLNKKMKLVLVIIAGMIVFYLASPRWVTAQLLRMFDMDYFQYRVPKIKYYINTFVVMPWSEGPFTLLFGAGAGLYSSRAAEACAGGYIGIYDKFFSPYSSELKKKYIDTVFSSIDVAHEAKTSILGSARSSIMAIGGEFGLIGLILLVIFICYLYSGKKNIYKNILVTYWVLLMLFESVIEFPKMGVVFWIVYMAIQNSEKRKCAWKDK